jgi:uncharacterized damage-inducible protein DinB
MTKDDIHLLYEYDRWANRRVLQAASALGTEQFTRDLGGAFRSVRDTLVHIIAGEWGWLEYWRACLKGQSIDSAFLPDLDRRLATLFAPAAFPDVAAVERKWTEVEKEQVEFLNRVTDESLQQMLPFREAQARLVYLMQHLANHGTYHRGQIALMMRQLGAEPLSTNFHEFLLEPRGESAPAR